MSESKLDQIVKGAPPPTVTAPQVAQQARSSDAAPSSRPPDPTSLLPSSPPQIYLNLLILEASLRAQYLTLRARRRQNTFVLTLLAVWIFWFSYAVVLRPREDGRGVGGSVYWVIDVSEKMFLIGGVVMGVLFWGTGQWERGVRWPRRWVGVANRGLRSMNCKIVLIKGPWWRELLSHLSFLLPYPLFSSNPGSSYHYIEYPLKHHPSHSHLRHTTGLQSGGREILEEDVAPGGDYIKLLLLPKPFSADFRQNWEMYRTEYWEKENERRAELRKRLKLRELETAKREGGWLWWTGWRGWRRATGRPASSSAAGGAASSERLPSTPQLHHHGHSHGHTPTPLREKKRRPSILRDHERDRSHSRSSSRSTTPPPRGGSGDADESASGSPARRRWSNSTSGSGTTERRRRKPLAAGGSALGLGIGMQQRLAPGGAGGSGSRPTTPTAGAGADAPTQSKRASVLSAASTATDSERSATLTPDLPGVGGTP
ncbi:uncharacterized protein K452DRAFT_292875 [Aplosporella prunicola CBS 121167]|uniref:Spo7-like protein n=1 Tax=Aplosporella prunicola CBS 121167 TaxID=1176127 RepID=A0A6A6AVA5_9PEZI|nr:uncharacterized protein K452DRAFT_292875 [Aplosporella prunicola CBS 121167]KAF2135869.1 hypothetical protein K452DRAFT_292875 [Aplosporella prunicola CBS 121167]